MTEINIMNMKNKQEGRDNKGRFVKGHKSISSTKLNL